MTLRTPEEIAVDAIGSSGMNRSLYLTILEIARVAATTAQTETLEVAAVLQCPGCAEGAPLRSYREDIDGLGDPDWNAALDESNTHRSSVITHGYDEGGSKRYCEAYEIRALLLKKDST